VIANTFIGAKSYLNGIRSRYSVRYRNFTPSVVSSKATQTERERESGCERGLQHSLL